MAKRALLCGCNYPGTNAELKGCVNDVMRYKKMLVDVYGFDERNITVLIDTDPDYPKPTGRAMKTELQKLIAASEPGDVAFFQFSGHGTQVRDMQGDEEDRMDEALVPCDMNLIVDDDLRAIFMRAAKGVKLTMVADCCHSGTMLDHSAIQISGDKAPVPGGFLEQLLASGGLANARAIDDGGEAAAQVNRSLPVGMIAQLLGVDGVGSVAAMLQQAFGSDASVRFAEMGEQVTRMWGDKAKRPMLIGGAAAAAAVGMKVLKSLGLPKVGPLSLATTALALAGSGKLPIGQLAGVAGSLMGGAMGGMGMSTAAAAPATGDEENESLLNNTEKDTLDKDMGVLITGCQPHETSADAHPPGRPTQAYGALTNAIMKVTYAHQEQHTKPPTNRHLVQEVRAVLHHSGFTQNPCLECSSWNADKPFLLHEDDAETTM